uniref:Uncharacterized protein n=1 Tax=Tanacetum cinerariifolium TaxID=118510 RepID=A0A6L2LYZ8_TANCI|nr:hypothetical protein [Tanacetum cinerariifolium]
MQSSCFVYSSWNIARCIGSTTSLIRLAAFHSSLSDRVAWSHITPPNFPTHFPLLILLIKSNNPGAAMFYVSILSGYEECRITQAEEKKAEIKKTPEQLILSDVCQMVWEMQAFNK